MTIIYQDSSVIIINKPPGFLSIPDRYRADIPNALNKLKTQFGEVFTVHRIDKETSGIMVFARTKSAHKSLSEQFESRLVQKKYHALVLGRLSNPSGRIEKAIAPHPVIKGKMIISSKGKPSISDYMVIEEFKQYSLVEVDIKTGRTHQIRVHFESQGFPLAIDAMYGGNEAFYLSTIKGKKYKRSRSHEERPLMSRCTLHAHELAFSHPETKEEIRYEADKPKDFRAVLNQLRKLNKL